MQSSIHHIINNSHHRDSITAYYRNGDFLIIYFSISLMSYAGKMQQQREEQKTDTALFLAIINAFILSYVTLDEIINVEVYRRRLFDRGKSGDDA